MIYLDNAATTRMDENAARVFAEASTHIFANSESLHSLGFDAMRTLEDARTRLAAKMGVKPSELYFCQGGTMADNTAVFGTTNPKRGGRVITSAYEHPAVLECFKKLEESFDVVYLKPENGVITTRALSEALTEDTRLVSIMHVNNETGAVNDIKALAALAHRAGALFHTDAVQAFMKEPQSYACVDMASFSAHKTHGPKGLGALYVKTGVKIRPVYYGGGHEKGLFSGTVNVPGAAAWATAAEHRDVAADRAYVKTLNDRMRKRLCPLSPLTVSPDGASPYILNVAFERYVAENIIHALSARDIYVSSGSACSSHHPGAVFRALGLDHLYQNALRISFSTDNTPQDVDAFCDALCDVLSTLLKK